MMSARSASCAMQSTLKKQFLCVRDGVDEEEQARKSHQRATICKLRARTRAASPSRAPLFGHGRRAERFNFPTGEQRRLTRNNAKNVHFYIIDTIKNQLEFEHVRKSDLRAATTLGLRTRWRFGGRGLRIAGIDRVHVRVRLASTTSGSLYQQLRIVVLVLSD